MQISKLPSLAIAFILLLGGVAVGAGLAHVLTSHQVQANARQIQTVRQQMDIPFLQHMNLHHDQALTLSEIMQSKAISIPASSMQLTVLSLAKNIEVSQRTEIGIFRGWLMLWEAEFIPRKVTMDWMVPNATEDELAFISRCRSVGGGMEGMATMEELNQLSEAKPDVAVDLFLTLMQKHHEAALPMLEYASRNAHTPQVKQLALTMWSEQRKELLLIQKLRSLNLLNPNLINP